MNLPDIEKAVVNFEKQIPKIEAEIVRLNGEFKDLEAESYSDENVTRCTDRLEEDLKDLRDDVRDLKVQQYVASATKMWICVDSISTTVKADLGAAQSNGDAMGVARITSIMNKTTSLSSSITMMNQRLESFSRKEERLSSGIDLILDGCSYNTY